LYKLFALKLFPMKVAEVIFLLLALLLIYLYWKPDLDFPYVCALIAILGCNPCFWSDKDNVLSDYPFCYFSMSPLCWSVLRRVLIPGGGLGQSSSAALRTFAWERAPWV